MMNKVTTAEVRKLAQWLNPPQPTGPLAHYRLTLLEGETYRLSPSMREIRVLSGIACVLRDEHEYILIHGEKRAFAAGPGGSVISVSGDVPLVVEMGLEAASEEQQRMKRQFYERMAERQQLVEAEDQSDRRW